MSPAQHLHAARKRRSVGSKEATLRLTGVLAVVMAIVLAGFVAGAQAAPTPQFKIIDLGTLGGSYSNTSDINSHGQVVGFSATAAGDYHAFSWTKDGGRSTSARSAAPIAMETP